MINFTVENNKLLFGLHGIKNVGTVCLENIIGERSAQGPFRDLFDFCKRVDLRTANKRVIEHLINAGAFDNTNNNRAHLVSLLDSVIEQALQYKKDSLTGQMGLFNTKVKAEATQATTQALNSTTWSLQEKLDKEKEVMGFYLSAHPLDNVSETISYVVFTQISTIINAFEEKKSLPSTISICALIKNFKIITTKKGTKMAFLSVEDKTGAAEVIVFPTLFAKTQKLIEEKSILAITGTIDHEAAPNCKIKAEIVQNPETIYEQLNQIKTITFNLGHENIEHKAKELDALHNGAVPVEIIMNHENKQIKIISKRKVSFTKKQLDSLHQEDILIKIIL
jgi:DNA polymerase-3 subunit alpha